jgi:hypothetical protein
MRERERYVTIGCDLLLSSVLVLITACMIPIKFAVQIKG